MEMEGGRGKGGAGREKGDTPKSKFNNFLYIIFYNKFNNFLYEI